MYQSIPIAGGKKMNRCTNCNVEVYESDKCCPLCKLAFDTSAYEKDTPVKYPEYSEITKKISKIWKVPVFVSIVAIFISVYINIFTHESGSIIWAGIVAVALFYINAVIKVLKSKSKRYGAKVLLNYVITSSFIIALDMFTGRLFWSTNYVFPFLTIAVTLYLTVLAIRSRQLFSEYFGYIMVAVCISFVPIPIYLLGFSDRLWGVFIAAIACVLIVIGLFLFADKRLKQEILKRFHR